MSDRAAKELLLYFLDRAGATPGPFWETPPSERAKVSALLGSIGLPVSVDDPGLDAVEAVQASLDGSFVLSMSLMTEYAIEGLLIAGIAPDRHGAIGRLRERIDNDLTSQP